jgi:thiamine-phosphate pyrophosphorylase
MRKAARQNEGVMLRGLYAVTPECPETAQLAVAVGLALAGGVRLVQYRSKSPDAELRMEQATALRTLCRAHGVPLIVNDSVEIAARSRADGVHVGRDDATPAEARRALGPTRIVGVSCYDRLDLARDAEAAGADYVAFGSFFPSSIKPHALRPPMELIAEARRVLTLPIIAIGGITRENAAQVIDAGADMVAVISAVFGASNVARAARELQALFEKEATVHENS